MKRSLRNRVSLLFAGAFFLWAAQAGAARAGDVRSSCRTFGTIGEVGLKM